MPPRNLRLSGEHALRAMQANIERKKSGAKGLVHADRLYRPAELSEPTSVGQKYGNVPTDGYSSKREARRADTLKLMQQGGQISDLREQVSFVLIPGQDGTPGDFYTQPLTYIADFVYRTTHRGELIVEDAKGVRTEVFNIKRKLMLWRHGIRVQCV